MGFLFSLPGEVLECILHESCNTGRKALRCTCTHLCRLVTPFVFETLVNDVAKTSLSNSRDRLRFFTALVSGKTLAPRLANDPNWEPCGDIGPDFLQ